MVQVGVRIMRGGCVTFVLTTYSPTVEIIAVARAMTWLESQTLSQVSFLSDSVSMRSRQRRQD